MKKISLVLSLALLLIVVFAFNVFAATTNNIVEDARFEQNGSKSDLLDLSKVIDGDYNTASSCGNDGENWVNYRFYYDEGTTVSKVFVVLNSTGTLSNGTVYETVSANSYEFYVRLYDKFENVVIGTKYHSVNNATEVKDAEGNVLYTYFEVVFDEPYSDIYMVEVPVVNNKNADIGLWEVEIYNYVCGDDEHEWVGTLCGEHCDVCGEVKDPTLACEAEEDDGDCRTAVLCKYCDSVLVASQKHVFAEGETVCSNDGCVFEGKNIAKDTTITPADVSENTYGENGEFLNWWYYSAHITDGKYNTIAHSNYFGQYKFTFTIKNPTVLSEIFIVSNSSGVYHPWGYGHDNLSKDFAVKVVIYDANDDVIQTVEYNSLDFTNPNVVPIYAESGEMTSVAYKLDANYPNAKKIELFIKEGVWEVEIYEHVTCDYQFVEVVAPTCEAEGYDLYKCACGNKKYENTVAALGHSYDEGVVTKEAGEEEDGEILYTCATCGGTKTLAIPATGHEHDYNTYVANSVEPTCAVVGSATYVCRCGDTTEVEIPATGNHNYNVFVGYTKEPTYLKDGFADYKCATCDGTTNVNVGRLQMNTAKYATVVKELGGWTVCEKYLIDGNYNLGSAGSHTTNGWAFSLNYGEDYTFTKLAFVVNSVGRFPSADAFNYTSKTTKNYSFAITLYDANGKAVWSKSTTCAEGVEMTGVDANGNNFLYDIVTIELDEAVVASKLYVKINSGWDNGAGMWEVETYGLPVNYHEVHDYTVLLEKYSDPTCTEDGSALYRCAKCETTSVVAIPATGHSYTYPCDKVCVVCNAESNLDATHTLVHVDAVAATCVNGNVEYWYCSDCGYAWLDEACTKVTNQMSVVVPGTGHSYFYACDKVCMVCYEETNPEAAHTIVYAEAVAPDCTNNGNVEYWYCSDCGYAWLDEACTLVANQRSVIIPATGHDWDEGWTWPWPTCAADGVTTYSCNTCGETKEEVAKADLENIEYHSCDLDWESYVSANCVTAGYEKYTCLDCGKVFEIVTEADTEYGHEWIVDESVSYDATCIEDGFQKMTCAICDVTKEVVLEKEFYGNHAYGYDPETYVEATCQQDGYAYYTCDLCGDSYEETTSAGAWLHTYVNSNNGIIVTCTTCNAISLGTAEFTSEDGFTAMFVWEGTCLNIWNSEYDIYYNATIVSNENGVIVVELYSDEDAFGINGQTVVLTLAVDGGTLVITAADGTVYTLVNKAPDYNYLLNGSYAYYDAITGNLMAAFKFENGIITVLVDNLGMGFPESFSYTYDAIEGTISTPEVPYANFSVYDGVIYFGRGFMLVEYDPTPAEPEEPVNYGDKIGSMDVTTTDTYGYIDLYSYTANKAGQYSFYIPAGLGFYSVAQYDVFGNAEIDFYDNANGYYVVVDLAAGETIEFYIGSMIAADWTIDVYFYTDEVHTHTEEIIPVVPSYKEGGVFYAGYTSGIKCAECGEILVAPVANDEAFQFKAISLSLSDYINIVYKAQVPAGYTNVYAVFTMNGNEVAVVEYTIDSSNGRYCFTFEGVKTQLLCDNVSATVYATTEDGLTTAYNYPTYSIKTYCSNQLNKSSVKAAEKVMLSNLLVVGAKAQKYAGYNTDVLATDGLESIMCATEYTTIPSSENMQTVSGDKSAIADWKTASLVVNNAMAIKLKVYVAPEYLETVSFKVVMDRSDVGFDNIERTFTYEDFESVGNDQYTFMLDGIRVVEYGSVLTCTIYNDGEQIGRTFTYSVNTYIQKNQGSTNPTAEQEFTRALYLYGKSARAFIGK